MTPVLSVVIPAYNVAPFIGQAVESALAQTLSDLEVVVVDDGSTDGTRMSLSAIRDVRLRVLHQENRGLAAARNTGIRAARGRYIGLLDGDDVWMPRKAELQVRALEARLDVALTFSHSKYIDEAGKPTGETLLSRRRSPSWRQMVVRNHVGNGSTPVARRDDLLKAGLFDEKLRTAMEDYEMWPRLMRRTGRGLLLVPETLTGYRVRGDSQSVRFDSFLRHAELARQIMRRDMPDVSDALLDLGLAGSYRVAARKAASLGRSREAIRYLTRAVRLAPWLPLTDARFGPTLLLAASGGRGQKSLHRFVQGAMRILRAC
jgi:glycosyltransferase involved in cell wall biosynthesis